MIDIQELYKHYLTHPNIITDSRKIEQGCIFFSLKGPHFNGNQYAKEAIDKGAAFAVVDENEYAVGQQYILVKDVLSSLQALARYHRQQFSMPLLAITGSNGKTTTKELLHAVFSTHFKTHCTQGNLNNHIGVPLTLLAMPADTEFAIVEMGANHVGEIDALCKIALPTHGIITNIGKAHLEGFKSLEGVKKAKSELYRHIQATGGMVFVNKDVNYLSELAAELPYKLLYGQATIAQTKDLRYVHSAATHPFVKAVFMDGDKKVEVNSRLMGAYNFHNILTAIVVARFFKIPSEKIQQAIENYFPQNNRSQLIEIKNNTYLLDAYNANPESMKQALTYFAQMPATRRIAILGDMLELGDYSEKEHNTILQLAVDLGLHKIWLVGDAFAKTIHQSEKIKRFGNVYELKRWYQGQQESNTHFLLKGSRGIELEKFILEEGKS